MRGTDAADPRLVLEVALVRLSRRDAGPPLQTVIERIERLERAAGGGAPLPTKAAPNAPSTDRGAADAEPTEAKRPVTRSPQRTVGALRRDNPPPAAPSAPPAGAPAEAAEPAEAPAAPAQSDAEPASPLDVDEAILAWGAILPELPVATRSAVQAAQPLRVDGDILVFGIPPNMLEAARPRFKKEADAIRAALASHLGRNLKFNLVAADEFSLGGPPGAPSAPAATSAVEPPRTTRRRQDDEVDVTDAVDAGPATDHAGVGLLRQELGATVIEELPRDAS